MNLTTEYPVWYFFCCLLLGISYSLITYYKERSVSEFRQWLKWVLSLTRLFFVSLIAFFLLNPLLKTILREVEKPIIIFAQDNSESLLITYDSSFYNTKYLSDIKKLTDKLSEKYDVKPYLFGEKIKEGIKPTFTDKLTDISGLLSELDNLYSNRNTGAIILATDGIYNNGSNPIYSLSKNKIPVYTIALGDTSIKKDVLLKQIAHNRLAYLGNQFPIEILLEAKKCIGEKIKITVQQNGHIVSENNVNITDNAFFTKIPVLLESKSTGIQRYTISVSRLKNEISYSNNQKDIFIDILDSRQKILLLADAPHPDIAAIQSVISQNENYEIDVFLAKEFTGNLKKYNLILFYQLPLANDGQSTYIQEWLKSDIPALFFIGNNTSFNVLSSLKTGINIKNNNNKTNESQLKLEENFNLFSISQELKTYSGKLPPLTTPFGSYETNGTTNSLGYQKIGLITTDIPLITFCTINNKKNGFILGEGVWRWKIIDYADHGSNDLFNELIGKIIQYLALKENKNRFKVFSKKNYLENEQLYFEAELYNESYELYNTPEVSLDILSTNGNKFSYIFSKSSNSYNLNAGILPIGEYTYIAKVSVDTKILVEKGEFSITEIQLESTNTSADHQLLYTLANTTGGAMFYPDNLDSLMLNLEKREDIKPIAYTQKKLYDLINIKWLFFLILSLVSFEWFLRKRNGAY